MVDHQYNLALIGAANATWEPPWNIASACLHATLWMISIFAIVQAQKLTLSLIPRGEPAKSEVLELMQPSMATGQVFTFPGFNTSNRRIVSEIRAGQINQSGSP